MSDAAMPNNLDAERGLLGAILRKNDAFYDVMEIITRADFFEPANGEIFLLMKDLIEQGKSVSALTLMHDYSQDSDIGGISASSYLKALAEDAPPPSVAKELAETIADLALRRRGIAVALDMARAFRTAPASTRAVEIRGKYDESFGTLFKNTQDLGIRAIGKIHEEVIRRAEEAYKNERPAGRRIGLAKIEELLGPWLPGRLYVGLGTPSAGKSILAQQFCEYDAEQPDGTSLLFEIEMEDEEISERALSARTGIGSDIIEQGKLDANQLGDLIQAAHDQRDRRFYVDGGTSPTVAIIRGKALRFKRLHGLTLLTIDQLIHMQSPDPKMKEHEAIRANLQGLKRMAKDLGIPVLVWGHLKQEYYNERVMRRPHQGDIYGGSAVWQEADVLFFLYRPEKMLENRRPPTPGKDLDDWILQTEQWKSKAEIILGKRRGGASSGIRTIYIDTLTNQFTDNLKTRFDGDGVDGRLF